MLAPCLEMHLAVLRPMQRSVAAVAADGSAPNLLFQEARRDSWQITMLEEVLARFPF